jgi:hypothetical protein
MEERTLFKLRTKIGTVAMAAAAAGSLGLFGVHAASAQEQVGVITLTDTVNHNIITSGGSTTPFDLRLSALGPGFCPGDTATGHYEVWAFMTFDNGSNGTAPGSLTFTQVSPGSYFAPPAGYASAPPTPAVQLADTSGVTWGGVHTGGEPLAVGTGEVTNLPNFSFAPFFVNDYDPLGETDAATVTGDDLFAGTWDLGLACTQTSSTTPSVPVTYWEVQLTLANSTTDPNGFVWSVDPVQATPEVPFAIVLPLSALAITGVGAIVLRRRKRHTAVPVS